MNLINKYTKSLTSFLVTKFTKLDIKLPKKEQDRVTFLYELCQTNKELDSETYVKINSLILFTIWFSEHDYEPKIQFTCLENIIKEYQQDHSIEQHLVVGVSIPTCYQMLIRNALEMPDIADDLIQQTLQEYHELIGPDEQLAYQDELLAYQIAKGDFSSLIPSTNTILELPKGEESDCYACIVNRFVRYYLLAKDYPSANDLIKLIYDEKLSCDQIPKRTVIHQLLVNHQLGLSSSIANHDKKALKNLKASEEYIWEAYFLLDYAIASQQNKLAQTILDLFAEIIAKSTHPEKIFYCHSAYLFSKDEHYQNMAIQLAKAFDNRNNNTYYSDYLQVN